MPTNSKAIPTADYEAVERTASYYCFGCKTGDIKVLSQAFHRDAIKWGTAGDDTVSGGSITMLYDIIQDAGPAPELKTRIDIIGMTPTTAVVRVDMERDAGGRSFTDFLTLLNFDGQWKVIAKVFKAYP